MSQQTQRFKNIAKGVMDAGIEAVESGVKTQAQQTAKSVAGQFGGNTTHTPQADFADKAREMTKEVVQDFYEPSDPAILAELGGKSLPKAGQLSPEEEKKKKELQMELHRQNYLARLYDRSTQKEEHAEKEQVKEEEKKMQELELEEKKKKDDDIALRMVTNKTEQFPGVSG